MVLFGAALGFWREATVIHNDGRFSVGYAPRSSNRGVCKTFPHVLSALLRLQDVHLDGRRQTCDCTVWCRVPRRQTIRQGAQVAATGEVVPQPQMRGTSGVRDELLGQEPSDRTVSQNQNAHLADLSIWSSMDGTQNADRRCTPAKTRIGDDSGLSQRLKDEFLDAGLLHVLVASGANLLVLEQFVQVTLFPVWRALRLPSWLWAALQASLAWAYAGACRFDVSIVRAALMTSHRWAAYAVGRNTSPSAGLLWAAVVLAAVNPEATFGISACLSFIATAAVNQVLFSPATRARGHRHDEYRAEFARYLLPRGLTRDGACGVHVARRTVAPPCSHLYVSTMYALLHCSQPARRPHARAASAACRFAVADTRHPSNSAVSTRRPDELGSCVARRNRVFARCG